MFVLLNAFVRRHSLPSQLWPLIPRGRAAACGISPSSRLQFPPRRSDSDMTCCNRKQWRPVSCVSNGRVNGQSSIDGDLPPSLVSSLLVQLHVHISYQIYTKQRIESWEGWDSCFQTPPPLWKRWQRVAVAENAWQRAWVVICFSQVGNYSTFDFIIIYLPRTHTTQRARRTNNIWQVRQGWSTALTVALK